MVERILHSKNLEDRKEILTLIAQRHLLVDETLETRKSDSLDFHNCSVWGIRNALEEAFREGQISISSQF